MIDLNEDAYAQNHIWSELSTLRSFMSLTDEQVPAYLDSDGDWTSYWPALYPAIEHGKAERGFAYNQDIATYAKNVLNVTGKQLDRLVYNTQRYVGAIECVDAFRNHLNELKAGGFQLITEPMAKALVQSRAHLEVQISPSQRVLLRLTYSQANGYFWKLPKHKIKGYPAQIGREYVLYSITERAPKIDICLILF